MEFRERATRRPYGARQTSETHEAARWRPPGSTVLTAAA